MARINIQIDFTPDYDNYADPAVDSDYAAADAEATRLNLGEIEIGDLVDVADSVTAVAVEE